jgi:hypothetical protein
MEEFRNLKLEYAFMKAKLLIYQKRSKKSQAEQWELYKEQVGEIIREVFESYRKDGGLYELHLETYQRVMPHLVMFCRNRNVAFTSEFSTHRSEEQSEGGQMEVDSMATPKSQPIELEVTFGTKTMSDVANIFGKVEGYVPIQVSTL